jgi:hypothetical protein
MSVIEEACNYMIDLATDNSHGYSQYNRWLPDVDCSSSIILAFDKQTGVKKAGATYTGNMRSAFVKCGFEAIPYRKGMTLIRGDVLLNEKHHTCLYLGNKKIVQASCSETGGITGKTGDQTEREVAIGNFYEYSKGWDYVLRYKEQEEDIIVNVELRQIQLGSQCPEVGTVQTLLNALGFVGKNGKSLNTDHDFGSNTDYAVRNFQKSVGLNPDGIVGKKTWDKILKADY